MLLSFVRDSNHSVFQVGMIDETAADKAECIDKCKQFLKRFERISPVARAITKQKVRQDPIKRLMGNRPGDVKEFLDFLVNPMVQQGLEMYIQSLKKKSAK